MPALGHDTGVISSVGPNSPATLLAAPIQGMKRGVNEANAAAQSIANGAINPDNFTALIQAEIAIKANRTVATTAGELVGALLDRKA